MAAITGQRVKHTGNMGLFLIGAGIYTGLLILFGWQTYQFVDWLFPGDQLLMKILTVLCFDVLALFWACVDLFYRFASRGAHTLVKWAWGLSFTLSLLASIFYLVIQSMFRFHLTLNQQIVNVGYGIVIFSLTLSILFLTFFLFLEWRVRHPRDDEYVDNEEVVPPTPLIPSSPLTLSPQEMVLVQMARTGQLSNQFAALPAPTPEPVKKKGRQGVSQQQSNI